MVCSFPRCTSFHCKTGTREAFSGTPFAAFLRGHGKRRTTMTKSILAEKQSQPIRAAVFSTVEDTKEAVSRLLAAGFTKDQITVICSDDTKERYFREFEHQEQAGSNTPAAAATGGAIGATIGGLATGAVGLAIGGVPLIAAGR